MAIRCAKGDICNFGCKLAYQLDELSIASVNRTSMKEGFTDFTKHFQSENPRDGDNMIEQWVYLETDPEIIACEENDLRNNIGRNLIVLRY